MADAFAWQHDAPASQGMDPSALDALRDALALRRTKALLVVRRDRIVYEWYAPDHGPQRPHYTASLAKALVGGISLLLALDDGRLGMDDPACQYIPAWRHDALKSRITIRHLATHTSGLEDAETPGKGHMDQGGWKEAFWRRDPDPFSIARDQTPVIFAPGTQSAYSNPGMAMLAYAVTASLRGAPQTEIHSLLKERIMDPLGVPEEWSIGYGTAYTVDGLRLYANWGGGAYTARAVARVGQLMQHKGQWQGRSLLSRQWVERGTSLAGLPILDRPPDNLDPISGLGWWINTDGAWPHVPRDAFAGAGAGNQVLLVVPSLELIAVRNGELLGNESQGETFWEALVNRLFDPLMRAVVA